MRAIVLKETSASLERAEGDERPRDVVVEDVADVGAPGPGEVVVEDGVVGVCKADQQTRYGLNGMAQAPAVIMGHERSARIAKRGAGVDIPVGTPVILFPYRPVHSDPPCGSEKRRVFHAFRASKTLGVQIDGAGCPRFLCKAADVIPVPGFEDFDLLAQTEPTAVGFNTGVRADFAFGKTGLVIGGGPIAVGAVACGIACGMKIDWVVKYAKQVDVARAIGARPIMMDEFDGLWREMLAIQTGKKEGTLKLYDCVADTLAIGGPSGEGTIQQALYMADWSATVASVGYGREAHLLNADFMNVKNLTFRPSRNSPLEVFGRVGHMFATMPKIREAVAMTATHKFEIDRAPEAFAVRDTEQGRAQGIKVLIEL